MRAPSPRPTDRHVQREVLPISGLPLGSLAAGLFLQVGDTPTCAPIESVGDVPSWLVCQADAHASLLVAAATIVTAVIAGLAHQREKNRIEESEAAADARIAGFAYAVRRTMARSLEDGWRMHDIDAFDEMERAQELHERFADNERRIEQMLAEASRASPGVAEDVRSAARLFWIAAEGVGELASVDLENHGDVPPSAAIHAYRNAEGTVEDCVEILRRLDAPVREAEG